MPYVSSTYNSPPSYSSGADKNKVAETSVLIRCPVVALDRIAVSTCVPKCPPPVYRLNIGGNTRKGNAADINSGDRASAPNTISPSFTATGCPSGSCRFSFTLCAWYPAVTLPSTHSAASRAARACATSPTLNTSGIVINIRPAPAPYSFEVCRSQRVALAPSRECRRDLRKVCSSEPEIHANQCAGSRARHQMAGMGKIDVITVQQVIDIDLEVDLFGDGVFQHGI